MKHNTANQYALLKALLISVIFLALTMLGGFVWETDDDEAIAFLLSRLDNDFSPFQWRGLSVVLHLLYIHVPVINWWTVCSVFSIWLSILIVAYAVFRHYSGGFSYLIVLFMQILLWYAAVYRMNFTRTAAVIAMAGCLLIADSVFSDRNTPSLWGEYAVGCAALLLGASIRSRCAMIALAFLAVIGMVMLLSDRVCFRLSWFKKHFRQIALLCMAAVLYFGAAALDQRLRTPEQEAYVEYNSLRSSIQDYSHRYPSYDEASEAYEAAGMDARTLNVLFHWFSEDTAVMNTETLKQITELARDEVSFDSLSQLPTENKTVLFCFLIFVLLLTLLRKKNWLGSGSILGAVVLCSLYLAVKGRFPSRVFEPLIWCAACSVTFLSGGEVISMAGFRQRMLTALQYCLAAGIFLTAVNIGTLLQEDGETRDYDYQVRTASEGRTILDLIDADQDHLYIFDIFQQPMPMESAFSIWEPKPAAYCENRFVLGGWEVRHPYFTNLQEEYGITNPVTALYKKTNVYSTYSRRVLTHLRIHYSNRITVSETAELEGYPLVQYAFPVKDGDLLFHTGPSARLTQFEYSGKADDTWYLSAEVDPIENGTGIYYCNITVNDMRYTYRLGCEGSNVHAHLYGLDANYDPSGANIQIFQLSTDGSYIAYSN